MEKYIDGDSRICCLWPNNGVVFYNYFLVHMHMDAAIRATIFRAHGGIAFVVSRHGRAHNY